MIELSLDLNKSIKSFKNRVVVRQGDIGEKVLISIYDNKKPIDLTEQQKVKLEGNLKNGDYVEGEANPYNSEKGKYILRFQSKDVSIIGKYQRAFLRIYDENDNRISSEEVHIEVLKDADISRSQATTYVSKLDNLLENMDQEFDSFMDDKESDYAKIDQKCDELGSELTTNKNESTEIKKTQSDILQSIKDNDLATKTELEIAKQDSSANVIYQVIGKDEAEITITLDYTNKTAKSDIENPNKMFYNVSNVLMPFTISGSEGTQAYYDRLAVLDNQLLTVSSITNEAIAQVRLRWELVKFIDKNIPLLFETDDNNQKIDYLRQKITSVKSTIYGRGTGSGGNKLDHRFYVSNSLEAEGPSNTTSQITKIIDQVTDVEKIRNMVSSTGQIDSLIYSSQSDGKLSSILYSDYAKLEVKVKVSAKQVIRSLIAANHLENLATQEEAETGTNNSKTMTPIRVFQAIAEWTKNKFVSISENQTILGTKNFQDGITFGDGSLLPSKRKSAISKKIYSPETDPGMYANGMIELERDGNLVTCTFAFKPVNTHAHGAKVIWPLGEFEPEGTIRMPTCEGGCYLYTDPADGNSIKIGKGLTKDQWATGTMSWIAKNRI